MVRMLEDEIKMDLPEGANVNEALLNLLSDTSEGRRDILMACTSCVSCNAGSPACVSCVCVSTGSVYESRRDVYGQKDQGYARNNL